MATSEAQLLRYRFGFIMEQNLGHRTHYRNLVRFVREDATVTPTWMPIGFDTKGLGARLPGLRNNWSARASLLAWEAVRRELPRGPLDALFYHTQVTSLLAPLHSRVPTVISLDATPINYDTVGKYYGHASGGRLERLKFLVNRRAFRAAAALVTWCAWARDSLVRDYGMPASKITVIPPGVDLTHWPRHDASRRAQGDDGRPVKLLFVGGEFTRKGGELLLQCFRAGLDERAELHVVTQAPVAPAPNIFVYHNLTPNSDTLLRLYAESDIFVFPSLADCAPLAVPEAMAAGLPVISTRVGAIPEMVREGETGLLLPPGDVAALRNAIETLLASPDLRARMGAAARREVESEYDARHNGQRLVDVLKAATDRAHRLPQARRRGR
ncbi:MAG TPA: glycosyltransferase family 4 protein [Ktedonobacterales bacterium]|nr:glycosyltransferase family 4 protein [Ktedonobacterales bacterium]